MVMGVSGWPNYMGVCRSPRGDNRILDLTRTLIEAKTTPLSDKAPLGRATAGFVRLYGRLRRLVWLNFDSGAVFHHSGAGHMKTWRLGGSTREGLIKEFASIWTHAMNGRASV